MWQILFPDKYVRYFDVPQNYEDAIGGRFYVQELEVLREDLGRVAGREITDAMLNDSIAIYNDNRAAIRELYKYRAAKPWQAPTSEVYLVLRAGMVLPPAWCCRPRSTRGSCATTSPPPTQCPGPSATTRAS